MLGVLGERIGATEAAALAAQLPNELKPAFAPAPEPERFDHAEFVRRTAERLATDPAVAADHVRATLVTVREAVSGGEIEDVELLLPADYAALGVRRAEIGGQPRTAPLGTAGQPVVTDSEFHARVAARTGLGRQETERATRVVLEAFGERISAGEAQDLAAQLPEGVARPLRRATENAEPVALDELVRRVAERMGILPELAREQVRAVLSTLRESVTAREWSETVAQLPKAFDDLLGEAPGRVRVTPPGGR